MGLEISPLVSGKKKGKKDEVWKLPCKAELKINKEYKHNNYWSGVWIHYASSVSSSEPFPVQMIELSES